MTDLATLHARLAEADEAYHKLQIGQTVTAVGADGNSVTYAPGNEVALARYIATLKAQIARLEGKRPAPRTIGFRF